MKLRVSITWGDAAWHEAVRLREPFIDVTSLPPVTPLPVDDLHQGAAGQAPMAARAEHLFTRLRSRSNERDHLAALLAEPHHVCWELWWGERCGGSHTFDLEPVENGTSTVVTREIVTSRHLGVVVMPPVRFVTGSGTPTMIQNLSFACTDLVEERLP